MRVRSAEHEHRAGWADDVRREGATLVTRRPVSIDIGAAGKGLLVDLVAQILIDAAVPRFVVDAGGDLRHYGDRPIRVGLEHPLDPMRVVGVVDLRDRALCASGVNRRAWGDGLHHVLDARTGAPTDDVLATWVIAEEAVLADGIATALFFVDGNRLDGMVGASGCGCSPTASRAHQSSAASCSSSPSGTAAPLLPCQATVADAVLSRAVLVSEVRPVP
jgi:thiamine biosynthesis lipoprotein